MPPAPQFNFDPVVQRLVEEGYRLLAALPMLLLSIIVIWLAWVVGGWLSRRNLLDRIATRNAFLRDLVRTTVRWIVLLVGVLIALEIMNATSLVGAVLGTAGVLGVALGFAFKDILENYLAGILMSLRQPFAPRDHIVIDGNEGVLVSLTSRATILMTLDGNHLRLPNALVFRSVMLNYTRNPSRRFEFDVGIGVNEDLLRAQALGTEELGRIDGVMATPPPRALITGLGDSNVQMHYTGWVDQRSDDFRQVRSEAIRRVKLVLEEAGMDMPEPIYRVQFNDHTAMPRVPGSADKPVANKPPADKSTATHQADTVDTVDTSVTRDIDMQIDQEKREQPSPDLLDPEAPRE